ncbi:MAG: Rieske 2Fe-2S domain-containing protein [Burkholderiales bacterium]|nr:Rieske 2Fe-2S domain-containing protein [Burkholderiales bacterium]
MTVETLICRADAVVEAGKGIRFAVCAGGEDAIGFVVRHQGKLYAYLNRCAHVPIELDWEQGDFFESSKLYIMCSTHGAIYTPSNGQCVGGPCRGGRLRQISIIEKDEQVYWLADQYFTPRKPSAVPPTPTPTQAKNNPLTEN